MIATVNYSQKKIDYNSITVVKEKSHVYYYPEIISTYAPMTTEGIMSNGPYNRVFCKIKPIFFNQLDTLFKYSVKIKKGFWAPCTVLKLSYPDTSLYLTIDSGGNFIRSDDNNKDSLYTSNINIIVLIETNVKGFKKYRDKKYVSKRDSKK